MMLNLVEIEIVMALLDAGTKAAGIRVFQNDGGVHLHSALIKLQQMAEEAAKAAETEKSNGNDHDQD